MTRLRRQMLDELERRNYSPATVRSYIRTVEDLVRYFQRRPDQLELEHIRAYQAHLFRERKLAANTVAQRVAASPAASGTPATIRSPATSPG